MDFETLIHNILLECRPDECMIVGESTTKRLIHETIQKKEEAIQAYRMPEYGHNMDVYGAIIFLFSGIQALASALYIISIINDSGIEKSKLLGFARKSFQKVYDISEEKMERIISDIGKWIEKNH